MMIIRWWPAWGGTVREPRAKHVGDDTAGEVPVAGHVYRHEIGGTRLGARDAVPSTEESCVYEVEVRKTLYHSTTFERVLVRPGQTTTLKAVLVKQYAGTVKYPDEQGGAK